MCSTCGCSGGGSVVTDLGGAREHGHDHPHDHDHPHEQRPEAAVTHQPSTRLVDLELEVLAKNDLLAARNRGWFEGRGILALNLMSSPGAGKTSLLERTIRDLSSELALSVIEGDQETLLDAERIRATGCRVVQINTGSGCHLDADMLARGLRSLDPPAQSVVFIENVGNLVCPALFDLGEHSKVVIMSVTEGDDKPLKYPHMFRAADVLLLNKLDLLPYVNFDVERCIGYARQINPDLEVLTVSATRGDELERWYDWLRQRVTAAV
ncbi:MAG: hydrogenase nickel incorporation protein HypB [Actinomycetota bacterium]|nr:hydrogenase nickel incorporation protein HypB [Actinomycetota bacterium]